ncbi:hypothetical protein EYF80_003734 [Liparis tanakae]|uniref:Uncharacterized protein n=1 Tax=Liparis tanakae TaxID=230148 RepID=A0A4Z2J6X2_9TELE|nr:hypothetical protein EYF80_003734 [Liparis tanakae]
MLPCPSQAGSDWSFQKPVGVDCSAPEPRCIWLAVLRRAAGSAPPPPPPPTPPPTTSAGHGQSSRHPGVRTALPPGAAESSLRSFG